MDEGSPAQNRRERRSNVLLVAVVETSGKALDVKLRNLSADGALIEAENLPVEGSEITFRKSDLKVAGKVVWVSNNRAGLQFHTQLTPEALLRHVPVPRPRVLPAFRRPGLAPQPLSPSDHVLTQRWGVPAAFNPNVD